MDESEAPDVELVLPSPVVMVLSRLVEDLGALHRAGVDDDDPVWQRLYPPASDDPATDHDLRDLVHPDLVERRQRALDEVAALLDATTEDDRGAVLRMDGGQATLLLGVVNDIRIALATRVAPDVLAGEAVEWPPRDLTTTQRHTLELVDHLAWVQEEVLGILDPASQRHYQDHDPDRDPDHDPDEA